MQRHRIRKNAAAIGILALGMGMSVAVFSIVDAVLLRPLPFPEQENIYLVWKADPLAGAHLEELAYQELLDLQAGLEVLSYAAVMPPSLYGYAKVLQTGSSEPVQIESMPVSHDFFRVLGVSPSLGRDFASTDERIGAAPVVIVSDRVWRDHLDADEDVIGQTIRLNGESHTVIGIMAEGADFPRGAGLWVPLGTREFIIEDRDATFLQAIVRTKPGISRGRLSSDVDALFGRLASEYPEAYSASQQGVVTRLTEYWTGSARSHLWVSLAASALLLVSSIVSAGHLLLSSVLSRRTEFATRLALGARRTQVLFELGVEGVAAAAAAVVLGSAVAYLAVEVLVRTAADIPRLSEATLDGRSFLFAAGVAAVAAIACVLGSGGFVSRLSVASALRETGGRISVSRTTERARAFFVTAQAASTVSLLVMAVLLALSYRFISTADTGFGHRDALSMNLQLRGPGVLSGQAVTPEYRRVFYRRLLEDLRAQPGVTSAAAILLRPLEGTVGWDVSYEFEFEIGSSPGQALPKANYEVVTPEYFKTVGTALLEGRDFDGRDTEDTEPVIIISHALAERIRAAGHEPLGHRLRLGLNREDWRRVIAVSADARYRGITRKTADLFVPYTQARQPTHYVLVRGTHPPAVLAESVRRTLAELDGNQVAARAATIGELIDRNSARHRFNMLLLIWMGVCASILAAAGVYSVVAESAAARKRELAIRAALGAQRRRLVRDMIWRTLLFIAVGEVLGILAAISMGAVESELLFGVSARDPLVLSAVAGFVFITSLSAAISPVWSAAGNLDFRLR